MRKLEAEGHVYALSQVYICNFVCIQMWLVCI